MGKDYPGPIGGIAGLRDDRGHCSLYKSWTSDSPRSSDSHRVVNMRFLSFAIVGTSLALAASAFPFRRWLGGEYWVDIWTAMPQLTESTNLPSAPFNGTTGVFNDTTIRQTLHVTLPANQIRLRLSNAFGQSSLDITKMTIATPSPNATSSGSSLIDTSTVRQVTFSGSPNISIPDMGLAVSDPIPYPVAFGDSVAVSIYLANGQSGFNITSHPGSRVNSWFGFGDQTSAYNITGDGDKAQTVQHWYYVSAIEGWLSDEYSAFAIVGDSITDGRASDNNENDRWPDLLALRMQQDSFAKYIAPVNQAAGGNRILADGLGPSAWSRIPRDVLAQSGIKYAMIFEGVNDIGVAANTTEAQDAIYTRLIASYEQIITQVHTFGIPVFGATITPFSAPNGTIQPYSDPTREKTRLRVNDWIMNSGKFDYVVDFATAVANPSDPSQLDPKYNSGDYLHPGTPGYKRFAEVFDVGVFERFASGVSAYT